MHHHQVQTSVLPPPFPPAKTQGKQQVMDMVYEQFKLTHSGHSRAGSPCIITEIYLEQENLSPMLQGRGKKKMELLYDGDSLDNHCLGLFPCLHMHLPGSKPLLHDLEY
ncbi:hypothetical protein NC652_031015 [Populus alba x Populus x berolinensis]|nr:hypothetical protein NC652_031009 [Populus alba x Populus x berolinensis]KAJ6883922.1 hypothetical protein NC652_031015 [Populus alba x Populus x berolinensis]